MATSSKNSMSARNRAKELEPLVAQLNCDDEIKCRIARLALVEKGKPAVAPMIDALKNGKDIVPLEAAKALGTMGGKEAISALIGALEDPRPDVRWVSAEALIKIGSDVLKPVLTALIDKSNSLFIREGAHHVLSDFEDNKDDTILAPVLNALDNSVPELEVPIAAKKVLDELE